MNGDRLTPRAHRLIERVETWAHRGPVRGLVVKVGVSVVGPLVVLAGVAMLVLPGPGLVVMALGTALLALEYDWARRVMGLVGTGLGRARRAVFPPEASRARRGLGVAVAGASVVATTGITAAVTAFVGTTLA